MKVKVFELFESGMNPLSQEIEEIIQEWLNKDKSGKASAHLSPST